MLEKVDRLFSGFKNVDWLLSEAGSSEEDLV
jgi:hypothetical protein